MHHLSSLLLFLAMTSIIRALPLNINLGAFSPALVVGDGKISFGGEADVSNLMTALGGASQEVSPPAGIQRASVVTEDGPTVVEATPAVESQSNPKVELQGQGIGRAVEPRLPDAELGADTARAEKGKRDLEVQERDLAGFNAALAFATGALKTGPEVQLGTGEGGSGVGIIVKPGTGETAEKIGKKRGVKFAEGDG